MRRCVAVTIVLLLWTVAMISPSAWGLSEKPPFILDPQKTPREVFSFCTENDLPLRRASDGRWKVSSFLESSNDDFGSWSNLVFQRHFLYRVVFRPELPRLNSESLLKSLFQIMDRGAPIVEIPGLKSFNELLSFSPDVWTRFVKELNHQKPSIPDLFRVPPLWCSRCSLLAQGALKQMFEDQDLGRLSLVSVRFENGAIGPAHLITRLQFIRGTSPRVDFSTVVSSCPSCAEKVSFSFEIDHETFHLPNGEPVGLNVIRKSDFGFYAGAREEYCRGYSAKSSTR